MHSPVVDVVAVDFYDALRKVASGLKVRRGSWPETECIFLHASVLHLRKADGTLHTLMVSDADLQGMDWIVVREN